MTKGLLVTGSSNCFIKIWMFNNIKKAKCIKTIENAHPNSVTSLLELPGNILASGCMGILNFWNFNDDYSCFRTIGNIFSRIMILISTKKLAIADNKEIKVYKISKVKCLYSLSGHI